MKEETRVRKNYHYWLFATLALLLGVGLSASVAFASLPASGVSSPAAQQANSDRQTVDRGAADQPYTDPKISLEVSCTITMTGSIVAADTDQTGRIFRDDPGSTCAVPQTCSPFDVILRNYDSYTITNSSAQPKCVTITITTPCEGTNFLQSAAYLGSFDPTALCPNYLGDIGASPIANTPKSYSVTVPAGATIVITVNEVTGGAGCSGYTLAVTGDICAPPPCTLAFSDVPPSNTFYGSVRCLACQGIVSGYADGTFRPNNPVTRGQLAKMVSNAAGFSEPVSGQTFEDVPPTQTFYEWIQRLNARGHMAGYPCTPGSPTEPCVAPGNRPYFRPSANATRGQTAKIVSNAAGFSEPVGGQTFQDVPPTHTFYTEIQRLANRGVMQGYTCGGASEPCVPPTNRPYFRPQNDVTRGQSSKIVANAFFPDCNPPARP